MTTIAIVPASPGAPATGYHAVAGKVRSVGRTAGEALDALTAQLEEADKGTLVVVQHRQPDEFFTAQQQQQWQEEEAARLQEGKPPREPKTFDATPAAKAQTNLTDPDWKIMPQPNKGWEYAGNAQVVVDDVCQIIVGCDVVPAANDKQQAVPLAKKALAELAAAGIARPVEATGQV